MARSLDYPYEERVIEDKTIREYRFQVELKDCFVLMSDGVIYAGVGELLNFGWTWESMAEYTLKCTKGDLSAPDWPLAGPVGRSLGTIPRLPSRES